MSTMVEDIRKMKDITDLVEEYDSYKLAQARLEWGLNYY